MMDEFGQAIIESEALIIRVPLANLPQVLDGAWMLGALQTRQCITDLPLFAKGLCRELNREDEQGTTMVHRMFDRAFDEMMESGAEGFEDHEEQDA